MSSDARQTPLDAAHAALEAAMERGEEEAGLRMAFYGQLLAAELHVVLESEPVAGTIAPFILDTDAGRLVLAFDLPERMAAFLDAPSDTAVLSGRALVRMLASNEIGIALNPDVAPSASVIGAEAVVWLAADAAMSPVHSGRIGNLGPPHGVPEPLVAALAARIGAYGGRVTAGYLAALPDEDRLVLALEGVPREGEAAVAAAIDEAVRFSGAEGIALDVAFPPPDALAAFVRIGRAFRPAAPPVPAPPGTDPERPPRLR